MIKKISEVDICLLVAKIVTEMEQCGPLKVSCINGVKTQTHKISGFRKEIADVAVRHILEKYFKENNLL